MISMRILLKAAMAASLGAILGASTLGPAHAQSYPDKPIKLILPYTPGSPNDALARLIAPQLAPRLGQPLVIDNRPGGGTTIGAKVVMTAEPDGYTLLFTNAPTHAIAPLVVKGFTYEPVKDFAPVAAIGSTSLVMVIAPSVPAKSLREFIAYAKANPGKLNFGYGQGTLPHLVGEAFKLATGIDLASIPYKGGPQIVTDVLGGRIHMMLSAGTTLAPLVRDGKLRALAVSSGTRSAELPDVPTMAESGLPDLTTVTHYGILGPAGMPAAVVARLNSEANELLQSPEQRASLSKAGFEPSGGSPQDFASLISEQMQKWAPIVKAVGFQME